MSIWDGAQIPEQRDMLATLLHTLNMAVTLAPRAQQHYPNIDGGALGT